MVVPNGDQVGTCLPSAGPQAGRTRRLTRFLPHDVGPSRFALRTAESG